MTCRRQARLRLAGGRKGLALYAGDPGPARVCKRASPTYETSPEIPHDSYPADFLLRIQGPLCHQPRRNRMPLFVIFLRSGLPRSVKSKAAHE
jgi:hypothetical protein